MAKRVTKQTAASDSPKAATTAAARSRRASPKTKPMSGPTEDQIRARAYEIYVRRNGGPGDAHSDWAQAEAELRSEMDR